MRSATLCAREVAEETDSPRRILAWCRNRSDKHVLRSDGPLLLTTINGTGSGNPRIDQPKVNTYPTTTPKPTKTAME